MPTLTGHKSRRGVTAVEYGIISALIVVGITAALTYAGTNLRAVFGTAANALMASNSAAAGPSGPLFGAFQTTTSTAQNFCTGSPISGFAVPNGGGIMTLNACGTISQSTVSSDLGTNSPPSGSTTANNSAFYNYAIISSPASGKNITVPAIAGAGTGFTAPTDAWVTLNKTSSGANSSGTPISFRIHGVNTVLNSTNMASASAACTAEGGSLSINAVYNWADCVGGKYYTGAELAASL